MAPEHTRQSELDPAQEAEHASAPLNGPGPEQEAETADAQYSYVSHNFDSMNRAIDNQIQKQELMSLIYRTQRYEKSTRTVFYVVATLAISALTVTLIWWLFNAQPTAFTLDMPALEDRQALQTLSTNAQPSGSDAGFINTSFTVFHRNLTPSGDHVVTGKTYAPENLDQPYEQYCYLESANAQGALNAIPLASYDESAFTQETSDSNLSKLIPRYCRFTAP